MWGGTMTVAANKGYHPFLESEIPYIFIDLCIR
jgi:hypothetical protein